MDNKNKSNQSSQQAKSLLDNITDTFQHNKASLRGYISRYLISSDDIEDVSQETFLRAYNAEQKRAKEDKTIEQPKAFLFRVAKNLILSEFSKKSRKITDYIEDFESPEVILEDDDLESNIMAQQKLGIYCEAVANLPKQCRQVVLLKKVYGLPNKEIANRMELSVSTVEKHLAKGIRDTQKAMAKQYGESYPAKSTTKDKSA